MSALPRPDLPPGAHHDLVAAMHDLHHVAGWPSLRRIAAQSGVSHTTVSKVFSAPVLPSWGTVELIVEALNGDPAPFHELWIAASTPAGAPSATATGIAGRAAEIENVRRHVEYGAGLLLVCGEAGIGKTTLVSEAAARAATTVVTTHCLPLSIEVPLMPVGDALRGLLAMDDGSRMAEAIADCPAFVIGEVARLLPELNDGTVATAPDGFGRQRLFTAIRLLLTAVATKAPVALCIEDLHWADPSTLDLIEHLCVATGADGVDGGGIAVVGTWREDDPTTPDVNVQWRARVERTTGPTTTLWLAPLTRAETRVQLAALGRAGELDAVFSRSRGHPLFTRHLAAHLPEPGLPHLLADLLDTRLQEIDGAAWKVAETLGVAGRPLPARLIATAAGIEEDEVAPALRALDRHSLLGRTGDSERASLAHPLLAEAARRRLVPGEGSDIHRRLAGALATGDDPAPAEVARHWQLAGDRDQEITWRVAAARNAASHFDWAQESEHWLRVLDLWPDDATHVGDPAITRTRAHLAAIDALDEARQWRRAAELSEAARSILPDLDDASRAEVLQRAAEYGCERDGLPAGLTLIDEALDIFDGLPPSRASLRAMSHKRWLLMSMGRFDEAHELADRAAELAQNLDDRAAARNALITLAWHRGLEGGAAQSTPLLERGRELCEDGTDPVGDIRQSVIATDILLMCCADLDEIEAAGRTGLEVAAAWGIDNMLALVVRANVATARLRAGKVAEAIDLIAVDAQDEPDPDRWPLHAVRAVIDTITGDPAAGVARFTRVWGDVVVEGEVDLEELGVLGWLHFWNGTPEESLEHLLRDLQSVADTAPLRVLCPVLLEAARAAAEMADGEGATYRAVLHDLCARAGLSTTGPPDVAAHGRTVAAELARLDGSDDVDLWARAAVLWDGLRRPYDAAYCRWRAAQVAVRGGRGTLASRLLTRAATDARQHVPLSRAIATTSAGAG